MMKETKRSQHQKRPELRGRLSDYRNHSKNSLRSDSFSCRFACLAYATQESKKIPIIVHPINASSCGMFLMLAALRFFRRGSSSNKILENILRQAKRQSRLPHGASCFLRKHSAPFFASFLSVMKEMKNSDERKERRILYLLSQGIHIQKVEPWPSPSEVTPI